MKKIILIVLLFIIGCSSFGTVNFTQYEYEYYIDFKPKDWCGFWINNHEDMRLLCEYNITNDRVLIIGEDEYGFVVGKFEGVGLFITPKHNMEYFERGEWNELYCGIKTFG